MGSIYTDKQQVRTVVNKTTGESKVFKSSGVDNKGKYFFTSSDSAKIKKFLTGNNPSTKTGLPVGKTKDGKLGTAKPKSFMSAAEREGPIQRIQQPMLISKDAIRKDLFKTYYNSPKKRNK